MTLQIHPEFREAFTLSKVRVADLAASVGMPKTSLGRLMASSEIRATPLTIDRLKILAGLLWYSGRLFR
jgi:hypothetical protein